MLCPKRSWYPHSPPVLRWFSWFCCRLLALAFGIRGKGLDRLAKGPVLVIAPHVNFLDPIFILGTMPRPPRFIADSYFTFLNPFLAWAMWLAGVTPVDRTKTDPYAVRQFLRLLTQNELCILFPEGGRSLDGKILPPLAQAVKLAAKLKVPVASVALKGAYDSWPRWDPLIRQPWGRVTVQFVEFLRPATADQGSQHPPSLAKVYDFKKKIALEEEKILLTQALSRAAEGESRAINLLRWGRPGAIPRLLCFCPDCVKPNGLSWRSRENILACSACGLRLKVGRRELIRINEGQNSAPMPIDQWFETMQNAFRKNESSSYLFASKVLARIQKTFQKNSTPLEPSSLRVDSKTFALRTASHGMAQMPVSVAARGNLKGTEALEIIHGGQKITVQTNGESLVPWLILMRKAAGWSDFFSEI
ncbi:MAG: 1-acyl-sn-glycerol-3-phosphate acyltransferase [Elusimicrobia bacterium]|nr:1-acyl-sn-glycerol-3-phosphate acyltransferase [Elusimicrobiota bacterium]